MTERRRTKKNKELFRREISGLSEEKLLCLEANLSREVTELFDDADHGIELLDIIDERLDFLEKITVENIIKKCV